MKPTLIILFLVFAGSLLAADDNYDLRPGTRKPAPVEDGMFNIFRGNSQVGVRLEKVNSRGDIEQEPEGRSALAAWLKANPVTGIAWSDDPSMRSAILGENVLRVGSSLNPDYVPFGDRFRVDEITREHVSFVPTGSSSSEYRILCEVVINDRLKSRAVKSSEFKK